MALLSKKILDDKYEIIHEIKQGGFGIVYYGVDNKLNKPVAIKEIAPTLLEDPKYLDMFEEEALNIAKLNHNNIVHIYELKKTADGRLYIIMEYIDGKDLEKILRVLKKRGLQFPIPLAVYIIAEICMALDYAHHRRDAFTNKPLNLVHQDISPSNIMISRFGGVKLIDFGIASVKRHQTKEKRDTKLRGKIPYMSPEQLIMGNHPDHRSDLFALGLVLYEILFGERLFNSQDEVIAAGKNPKWLKKALKGKKLPSALEKIFARALEIDLSKRYQSANHMYIDLYQYLLSCDITGELMDNLADFVNELFQNDVVTPGGNNVSLSFSDRLDDLSPSSEPSSPSPATNSPITNRWLTDDNHHEKISTEFSRPTYNTSFPARRDNVSRTTDISRTQNFPPLVTTEYDDSEDDENMKTVIDVIRISARNNKRRIVQAGVGLMVGILIFGVLDTLKGWTRAGVWMYDKLFPPAIEIVTVPPNAQVFIDDQAIAGRSPVAIDKIAPGVHKLELQLEGYKPIVKSLFVPREGAIRVQGENQNSSQTSYLFRFNTEIQLESDPPNAAVYINGIRYTQKTPCAITWEVGNPLAIEMELEGFDRLTGFSLNTLEGFNVVEDRRFWEMNIRNDQYTTYLVKGVFRKPVIFETVPAGVEIVDTKSDNVIGVSGRTPVVLSAGRHELELRKRNFNSQRVTVQIDKTFTGKISAVLSRNVQFRAYDESDPARRDIGAQLIILRRGNNNVLRARRTTPFELTLPAYAHTAVLQKDGYQRQEIQIGPEDQLAQAEMEALRAIIEINVADALSGLPITGAEIYYNYVDNPRTIDIFFDQTNASGEGFGQLPAGNYVFTVKKSGYRSLFKTLLARAGDAHPLEFKLYPSN